MVHIAGTGEGEKYLPVRLPHVQLTTAVILRVSRRVSFHLNIGICRSEGEGGGRGEGGRVGREWGGGGRGRGGVEREWGGSGEEVEREWGEVGREWEGCGEEVEREWEGSGRE